MTVRRIREGAVRGKYPRLTGQTGESPFAGSPEAGGSAMGTDAGADTACLVGEVHLNKKAYEKAIEAFTRAIEARPTADAYEGRARAYRGLAERDEEAARRHR